MTSPIEQDGTRVLIAGRLYRTFMTETNAARCTALLQGLADLGCELPEARGAQVVNFGSVLLRRQLEGSLALTQQERT
jgi:hypothetical protein